MPHMLEWYRKILLFFWYGDGAPTQSTLHSTAEGTQAPAKQI